MDKQGIDYLKKYSATVQVLSIHELTDPTVLPAAWLQLLSQQEEERIAQVLLLWQPFQSELENTLGYLRENLRSVDLIHQANSGYSLVYGIQNDNKKMAYYEGRNPLSKNSSEHVRKHWNNMPAKLSAFYEELHNGWYYFASESMGLAPVESWSFLGDDEWGIVEELGELNFSLDTMLAVYPNGMGDYVCFDVSVPGGESILWWHTKAPRRNIDFWQVVDIWTHIGMTN